MSEFWTWVIVGLVWSVIIIIAMRAIYNNIDPFSEKGAKAMKAFSISSTVADVILATLAIVIGGWPGFWGCTLARFVIGTASWAWTYKRELKEWFKK